MQQLDGVYADLFNLSLSEAVVPRIFRSSIIISVLKRPDTTILNDFRPVALTSVSMKCREKLVLTHQPHSPGPRQPPPVCILLQLISGRHGSSTPHSATPERSPGCFSWSTVRPSIPSARQTDQETDRPWRPNSYLQLDSRLPDIKTTGGENWRTDVC